MSRVDSISQNSESVIESEESDIKMKKVVLNGGMFIINCRI
jgi:hypothetical protein